MVGKMLEEIFFSHLTPSTTVVPLDWVGVYSLTAPRLGAMYGVRVEAVARRLTEGGARVGLRVALRG